MAFPRKLRNILPFLIFWRLSSVFVVQTFHVPDEYWQSLEVAHRLAFGYGYLTWEWRARIRSYIYPFLISILYRILALAGLDYPILLTNLPRIFQALLSAFADYRFYVWTKSKWALLAMCTNWFWYYCATRTLANSLETALTTIALSVFPWPTDRPEGFRFLWLVGFLVAVRPTAAILWLPLCVHHVFTSSKSILESLKIYSLVGLVTLSYSVIVDSLCYGTLVLTPWEFFRANILHGVADFYGTHNFAWYFFSALPILLGLHSPVLAMVSLRASKNSVSRRSQSLMLLVIFWTLAVYSILPHKEFRFVLPLLPLLLHVCTVGANLPTSFRITASRRKIILGVFLISNLLPGFYFSLVHQRGSLDVMKFLNEELRHVDPAKESLVFLTPCHATPLYSHLHKNVSVRFLGCEPDFEKLPNYRDEADEFFNDPMGWIDRNSGNSDIANARHLVMFDNLSHKLLPFLRNYRLIVKLFHAHFPQSNYGKYIEVYEREFD